MRFQNPQLLFALSAIAIPILIHLLNLRKYKTIRFSNIQLLKEIQQEKRSYSKIRNLLVLLSRILVITFLVLAFANPFIANESAKNTKSKDVFIYIDNSFSMEQVAEEGMLLDLAKQKAEEIVSHYPSDNQFYLITNDFSAEHNRPFSKGEFSNMVQKTKISAQYRSWQEILSRQKSISNNSSSAYFYLLSDLQKSTLNIENLTSVDTNTNIIIIPIKGENTNNLFVDSCWTNTPFVQKNMPIEILVMLTNKSEQNLHNIPAYLYVNNQKKAIANFDIESNSQKLISFQFSPDSYGHNQGKIVLQDYPITFDDNFYFSFDVLEKINVMAISKQSSDVAITSLFKNDEAFLFSEVSDNQVNYEEIQNQHLLVLEGLPKISTGLMQSIEQFVGNGGSLVVFPHPEMDNSNYQQLANLLNTDVYLKLDTTKQRISNINYNHAVFTGVFEEKTDKINLPTVQKHFRLSNNSNTNSQHILTLEYGNDFIRSFNYKYGNIYLFASGLGKEFSNLGQHAIFVPLLYNMAMMSQKTKQLYYRIGEQQIFDAPNSSNPNDIFHLTSEDIDMIPTERIVNQTKKLYLQDRIPKSGNYLLTTNNHASIISFNYDKKESDLTTYSTEELETILQKNNINSIHITEELPTDIATIVQEMSIGKYYWKTCIILALLFLLIEVALIKFLKS